jgi:hypothetical protein
MIGDLLGGGDKPLPWIGSGPSTDHEPVEGNDVGKEEL